MCTVSFVSLSRLEVLLTASRDENLGRPRARAPEIHSTQRGNALYPVDGLAGGTWFSVHERGYVLILLNGGFENHEKMPVYRKSRGQILLDLLQEHDSLDGFQRQALEGVEPFTLVVWNQGVLSEGVWDGRVRHWRDFPPVKSRIWSSATLYTRAVRAQREVWLDQWLADVAEPNQNDLIEFHLKAGAGDPFQDVRMNRGQLATLSITSAWVRPQGARMSYVDLTGQSTVRADSEISFSKKTFTPA